MVNLAIHNNGTAAIRFTPIQSEAETFKTKKQFFIKTDSVIRIARNRYKRFGGKNGGIVTDPDSQARFLK